MEAPHIWVPKLKIVEFGLRPTPARARGFFIMQACNRYGQVRPGRELCWEQLITDQGMTSIYGMTLATNNGHTYCRVGTGSPTFTNSSTGLDNSIASTGANASSSSTSDTTGSDGYRVRYTVTKEFTLGGVVGNLTEVGMFSSSGSTTGCFLDLIRDSGGSPTTFPVTADDQLRVTHVLDFYPNLSDSDGSFTIGGSAGSGSHDYLIRSSGLASSHTNVTQFLTIPTNVLYSFRGVSDLGSYTSAPTGTQISTTAPSSVSTSRSDDGTTWTNAVAMTLGLSVHNHVDGIGAMVLGAGPTAAGNKVLFTPAIPKFAGSVQRILTLNFEFNWARV